MQSPFAHIDFLKSAPSVRQAPPDHGVEVAFAGRSNAGKSSALNAITGRHALARTSKTPGRTQLLNFFRLDDRRRLVDLPGYGYARVPSDIKRQWQHALNEYLSTRRSLRGVMLVMDVRHPLTDYDLHMLEWCTHAGLDCHILLTKADKLSRGAAQATLLRVRKAVQARYDSATVQLFSALRLMGLEEAWARLDAWLVPAGEAD